MELVLLAAQHTGVLLALSSERTESLQAPGMLSQTPAQTPALACAVTAKAHAVRICDRSGTRECGAMLRMAGARFTL